MKALFGRVQIIEGRCTIIQDCYNANPESMNESLEFADSLDWGGRKLYVLGAMGELGCESPEFHRLLGKKLFESDADVLFLIGEDMRAALPEIRQESPGNASVPELVFCTDISELEDRLGGLVRDGDLVLLKGSRSVGLERLVPVLTLQVTERGMHG